VAADGVLGERQADHTLIPVEDQQRQ
jgi:hypothetical protein